MTMFKSGVQSVHLFSGYSYACRHCRHWPSALSMIRWSKRRHSWISRSFKVDVTDPAVVGLHWLLQNSPDRIVNRNEIGAVWWPVLRSDEVRHLSRQQCNRFASMLSQGIVWLKREERSRYERMAGKRCCRSSVFRWHEPFVFTTGSLINK